MIKQISCFALCLVLSWGILVQQATAAGAADEAEPVVYTEEEVIVIEEPVEPVGPSLFVDKQIVEQAELSYRNGIAYVSLRHACLAMSPDATIEWLNDHAMVTAENLNIIVYPETNYVIANGRCLYLPQGVIKENGIISIPARTLAMIFNSAFIHDTTTQSVYLTSGNGTIHSGDEFYDEDDLYWLSLIINAESGNQPLAGKIAVGNVVLNRTKNPVFPSTIYDVIFQKNQFTPAKSGSIHLTPNEESILAAKLCLEGVEVLPTALYFNHTRSSSWAAKHKSYVTTIGSHAFYA